MEGGKIEPNKKPEIFIEPGKKLAEIDESQK